MNAKQEILEIIDYTRRQKDLPLTCLETDRIRAILETHDLVPVDATYDPDNDYSHEPDDREQFMQRTGGGGEEAHMTWSHMEEGSMNRAKLIEKLEKDARYHARPGGPGVLDYFRLHTAKRIRSIIRRLKRHRQK